MITEPASRTVTIPISEYDTTMCSIARAMELSARTRALIDVIYEAKISMPAEILDAVEMAAAALSVFTRSRTNNWN